MTQEKFNLSQIARRITHKSLRVRNREVILIVCGKHNIEFAEEIAAETALSGGYPIIKVASSYVMKEIYTKASPEYIKKPRQNISKMMHMVDGIVMINSQEDPCYFSDIPFERLNLASRSMEEEFRVFEEMQLKRVLIEYPTPQQACFYDISYEELFQMVWGGIQVDPSYFEKVCDIMHEAIKGKTDIRIQTEKGTDLRFSIRGRKMLRDTGTVNEESFMFGDPYVTLPAGEVFIPPVENSAEGVLVCDEYFLQGRKIFDLSLRFEKGRIIDFSAREGCNAFREYFESLSENGKVIAEFGIGLNPYINKVIGLSSTDEKAMGTAHVGIGHNTYYGGVNHAENHDDFVIQNPTIRAEDITIMENGKLTPMFNIKPYPEKNS